MINNTILSYPGFLEIDSLRNIKINNKENSKLFLMQDYEGKKLLKFGDLLIFREDIRQISWNYQMNWSSIFFPVKTFLFFKRL